MHQKGKIYDVLNHSPCAKWLLQYFLGTTDGCNHQLGNVMSQPRIDRRLENTSTGTESHAVNGEGKGGQFSKPREQSYPLEGAENLMNKLIN